MQQIKKFEYIYLSVLLLPAAIVSGPFVSDLIISLIAIYFLATKHEQIKIFFKKYFFLKVLFIFCITNIIISLFSENVFVSLKNSLTYIRFPIFLIALSFFFKKNFKYMDILYYSIFFTVLIVCYDACLQFFTGKSIMGFISNSRYRVSGFFRDEYILGSFLARMTPILIAIFYIFKEKKIRTSIILLCILSYLTIIFSGERTSTGIITIFYLLFFIFVINFSFKNKIYLSMIIIFSFIFIIFSSYALKTRFLSTTQDQLTAIFNDKEKLDVGKYNNQHMKHLLVSYEMFKKKPVFGYGNKMFQEVCYNEFYKDDGRCSTHPHNFTAQIAVENGIVGLFFYAILFGYFVLSFFKHNKKGNESLSVITLSIIVFLSPIFPSGSFYNNLMSIFLYFPIAIHFILLERSNEK
tara:strand:- start:6340 stop:7566 length:1227 start_codon:yes stop_codon:yes gene_type:complete